MKFLVASDGSAEAEAALTYATDLADAVGGSITVAHVVDPTIYDTGGSEEIASLADAESRLVVGSVDEAEDRGQDILDAAADFVAERGLDVDTELLYGTPVEALTDYAEQAGFDTIVLGHRGRTERAELMVGSTAKAVVERATVPVTVVR